MAVRLLCAFLPGDTTNDALFHLFLIPFEQEFSSDEAPLPVQLPETIQEYTHRTNQEIATLQQENATLRAYRDGVQHQYDSFHAGVNAQVDELQGTNWELEAKNKSLLEHSRKLGANLIAARFKIEKARAALNNLYRVD